MAGSGRGAEEEWISHGYFRTYEVAARLADIARSPISYARDLEGLVGGEGILDFLPNWQKTTAVHRFAEWIADEMFLDDTNGPYVTYYEPATSGYRLVRRLPVDCVLEAYGIATGGFDVPPPDGEQVEIRPRYFEWRESAKVANECYDYFLNEVRLSQEYEDLMERLTDEVFHIFFLNRRALAAIHAYLAGAVLDLNVDGSVEEYPWHSLDATTVKMFTRRGVLKRSRVPEWAKKAVYHREHGRCAACRRDVSGLLDAIPGEQFDHMIPLAAGGLNDVSNLQLLCAECNREKAAGLNAPSAVHRRWYKR